MPACMYAWPQARHHPLYLLLVLDSSANFPVDVGIFSVCHLNCLITWIDCEKRATAAAAAAKATVTAIVTATYPFWAAGRGSCGMGHLPLPSVKKVMAEVDVVSMCLAARRTTKLNGHLLPLCFVIVYCCCCSCCCRFDCCWRLIT